MSTRRLILLRHGRTAWNAQRRFQGHADPPLDEVGRAQAYEVSGIIAALRPDLMVSSSATRAMQTAGIVAESVGLPFASDIRFRERGLGHWEGLTLDEVSAAYPTEYAEWAAGRDIERPGGETRDQVATRALDGLADLGEAEFTLLVTHGATAMAVCNALLGLSQRVHPLGALVNCHWTELYIEKGRDAAWRVRGHNLGAPGAVVPLPERAAESPEPSDADA
ncbi:MAG: histidine phosphatase family protein [Jatrophihabitans sp.]